MGARRISGVSKLGDLGDGIKSPSGV